MGQRPSSPIVTPRCPDQAGIKHLEGSCKREGSKRQPRRRPRRLRESRSSSPRARREPGPKELPPHDSAHRVPPGSCSGGRPAGCSPFLGGGGGSVLIILSDAFWGSVGIPRPVSWAGVGSGGRLWFGVMITPHPKWGWPYRHSGVPSPSGASSPIAARPLRVSARLWDG